MKIVVMSVAALLVSAGLASASIIVPESQSFGQLNRFDGTPTEFSGDGIPSDQVAFSTFDLSTGGQIRIGLSTHGRYGNPDPSNDGAGSYRAQPGANAVGAPTPVDRALWNFNVFAQLDDGATVDLIDLDLTLLYDFDPTADTQESDYGSWSLSNTIFGFGLDSELFETSQNPTFDFLNNDAAGTIDAPDTTFDPFAIGEYGFALRFNDGGTTRQVAIQVSTVPLPAAGLVLLTAFAGAGLAYRRRKAA